MLTLILDNIRSCHNVGSIFRSADAFGVERIICCGITPRPAAPNDARLPHIQQRADRLIAKTALGAEKTVPFSYFNTTEEAIKTLEAVQIVALEQTSKSIPLKQFQPETDFALVVGNEPNGITEEVLTLCHNFVEIPMLGHKESLNVSVATGIALFALQAS